MLFADFFVLAVLAIGLASLGLSGWYVFRWDGGWRVAALAPVVCLLLWIVSVVCGWPSEHTLWPFELVLISPICLAYVASLRVLRGRWLERKSGDAA